MQNNVCKSCGGDIRREGNYYVCNFCGSRWTIDADSDIHVIDRANAWGALRDYDFERAVELFEHIIAKEPNNSEAYWGRALADAGIVYVTDLNENKKVPTCNNIRESSFIESRDVKKAISLAPKDIAESYTAQAQKIEDIRTEWLKKASKEPPYDVFICFKDSDRENGLERTKDSYDAQELYYALTSKGYKVFFSRVSLRNKISEHYEPYIYNALKTAKVMIVFGEKPEYFSAVWVKNEWNRFRAGIERGEKNKNGLVVVCKGMDPGDLPAGLRSRQCLNAGDITFLDDLKSHIDKVIAEEKAKAAPRVEPRPEPKPTPPPYSYVKPDPIPTPKPAKKKKTAAIVAVVIAVCIGLGLLIDSLERSGMEIPEDEYPTFDYGGGIIVTLLPGGMDGDETEWIEPTKEDRPNDTTESTPVTYESTKEENAETVEGEESYKPPVADDSVASEGLSFVMNGDGTSYMVTGRGECQDEMITIPSTYDGYPVTAIEADAFYNDTLLKSIHIPNSVTEIGDCAFYGCNNLEYMSIPFAGNKFGGTENTHFSYIFGGYSHQDNANMIPYGLHTVDITGDGEIAASAFYNSSIQKIIISGNVTKIGSEAFAYSYNLYDIVLSDSIQVIDENAFNGCNLRYTEHENGRYVASISNDYFMLFEVIDRNVRTFTLHADTKIIYNNAFSESKRLQSIDLSGGLTCIGASAFANCSALETVVLGEHVQEIGRQAFAYCTSLSSINLTNNLRKIGAEAFRECAALTKVTVPDSVQYIGDKAFAVCTGLEELSVPFIGEKRDNPEHPYFCYIITGEETWWIDGMPPKLKTITITDCSVVPASAFTYNGRYFETITLPQGVTEIGDYAFENCSALQYVNIPEGVTRIGECAFNGCSMLNGIELPSSVKEIGQKAFAYCTSLERINVPSGVTELVETFLGCSSLLNVSLSDGLITLGLNAFYGCDKLAAISIPNTVTTIGTEAFYGCDTLAEVIVPDSVKTMGYGVFRACGSLQTVVIGSGVETFEGSLFYENSCLQSLTIPFVGYAKAEASGRVDSGLFSNIVPETLKEITVTNATTIPDYAFTGLNGVEKIFLNDGITAIGYSAFDLCSSLVQVNIPDTVTSIGDFAFYRCSSIEGIDLPDGLTHIGKKAFSECSNLKSMIIPDGITYIGMGLFEDCTSIQSITIPFIRLTDDNGNEYNHVGHLFSSSYSNYIGDLGSYVPSSLTSITLTQETEIPEYQFSYATYIEEINLCDGIINIGNYAFMNCEALTSIVIPEGVQIIRDSVFENCINLASISLPHGLTEFGYEAFANCEKLSSIDIPSTVVTIGNGAFSDCTSLKSIVIPDGVIYLYSVFSGCTALESITLPCFDTMANVFGGSSNFENESATPRSLKTVIVTKDTEIDPNAFFGCKFIENIILPETVTRIGSQAFSGCTSLKSVNIPSKVKEIELRAFEYCTSLETVVLPHGLETIRSHAFIGCTALKEIVIPSTVTALYDRAFYGCQGLTTITIPKSITDIWSYTFYDCISLTTVNYSGTEQEWQGMEIGNDNGNIESATINYNVVIVDPNAPTDMNGAD